MKKLSTLLLCAALAGSAFADGYETNRQNSNEVKRSTNSERSNKNDAAVDIAQMLSTGLAKVVPQDDRYVRRLFYIGWQPEQVTEERVGGDIDAYLAARRQALMKLGTVDAKSVLKVLDAAKTPAEKKAFVDRETMAMGVIAAHSAFFPEFGEVLVSKRRYVTQKAFYIAYQPALVYHSALANFFEGALGEEMLKTGAMPLDERRSLLVRLFFEVPASAIPVRYDPDARGELRNGGGMGSDYQLIIGNMTYGTSEKGIYVYGGGGLFFGGGTANGVKYSFTDGASNTRGTSTARTKSNSTSRRDAYLE